MKICLIIVDCLRPDHLGCHGYERPTSPNLDALARNSLVFENAYAQSNWTYPSIYSMITGRYPSVLDINWFDQKISSTFVNLPEMLAENGFRTGIFSNFKVLLNQDSFCHHFQDKQEAHIDEDSLALFQKWFQEHKDAFLIYHMADYVHEPFYAPKELVQKYLTSEKGGKYTQFSKTLDILVKKSTSGNLLRNTIGKINKRLARLTCAEIEYLKASYDAGIFIADRFVGRLKESLDSCHDEYLLIVCADHGQAFMEHKVFGHGLTLYNEVIQVPLIIYYPGCTERRIAEYVQLMDLFPTMLDYLQYEIPDGINGASFFPVFNGSQLGERVAFSEGYPHVCLQKSGYKLLTAYSKFWEQKFISERFSDSWTNSTLRNILNFTWKYRPSKLFDLQNDPQEIHNVRFSQRQIFSELFNDMQQIMYKIRNDRVKAHSIHIDEAIQDQLQKLGYL